MENSREGERDGGSEEQEEAVGGEREGAIAQPPVHLREERGPPVRYFQRGRHLSIKQIVKELRKKEHRDRERLKMLKNLNNWREHPMGCRPARLEVSWLQHVAGRESFKGITREQRFTGGSRNISNNNTEEKKRFSWWSVVVTPGDRKLLRDSAYEDLYGKNRSVPTEIAKRKTKVKNQFANSPVFNEKSRYGNFKFSYPVEELLAAYSEQHCTRGELVFRVLGTWTYRQEVQHAVLIHGSEDNDKFSDLPEITEDETQPIYRLPDGTFRCRLESSSDKFIQRDRRGRLKFQYGRGVPCVWNNPVFAFYLPEGAALAMPISEDNLEACKILEPHTMSKGCPIPESEADRRIQEYVGPRNQNQGN